MISIIIPTYNERENISKLVPEVFSVLERAGLRGEVIVVDDDSPDKTFDVVKTLSKKYDAKLVLRKKNKGLSSAVIEGFKHAKGAIVGVMDADFSHPPGSIPDMVKALEGSELVVGSRHVKGGSIREWSRRRKLTSRVAMLLARPLTSVKDPVSGFFFFRRGVISGVKLSPRGFKIGLEIIVKGKYNKVREVPFVFENRRAGSSKLGSGVIKDYLFHVLSLYKYKLFRR
jgi:dolichol-phosphate mannosyltransferase